ncbi:hypothetical protein PsorP6_017886 [Peronosclerospora sorghi]|uniref:Uncharacterized protein n=1 Tax=Peronosclerospora sorghi TaxID=230839 RepID=A0ACC0WDF5_9STRA|nr:hypothetical protein PsorP6_017886 [Peronosclerospora sorghi]
MWSVADEAPAAFFTTIAGAMIAVLSAEASASGISGGALIGSSPEMSTTSSGRDGGGNDGVGAAGAVDTPTVEAVKAPGDDPRAATGAEATGVEATGAEVTGVGATGGVGALEGLEKTVFTIVGEWERRLELT